MQCRALQWHSWMLMLNNFSVATRSIRKTKEKALSLKMVKCFLSPPPTTIHLIKLRSLFGKKNRFGILWPTNIYQSIDRTFRVGKKRWNKSSVISLCLWLNSVANKTSWNRILDIFFQYGTFERIDKPCALVLHPHALLWSHWFGCLNWIECACAFHNSTVCDALCIQSINQRPIIHSLLLFASNRGKIERKRRTLTAKQSVRTTWNSLVTSMWARTHTHTLIHLRSIDRSFISVKSIER